VSSVLFRGLLWAAAWIVPRSKRAGWHARWASSIRGLWTLLQRGELIRSGPAQMACAMRLAFTEAFWLRFNKTYLAYAVRGPGFLLLCAACGFAAMAAGTRGFRVTRTLVQIAMGHAVRRPLLHEGPTGTLIAYSLPIVLALGAAVFLAASRRFSLLRRRGRYLGFLVLKTGAVLAVLSLVWIEGGTLLRAHLHNETLRVLCGAVGLAMLFIFVFGRAMLWSFDDQRRRCPNCLRLLTMPVTIGSWGSMFEPAITEFLCDDGHGILALSEDETLQADHWTELDASWRELFERTAAKT